VKLRNASQMSSIVSCSMAIILALFIAPAAQAAQPQICGLPSGNGLVTLQDSINETAHSSVPLAAALDDLISFPDIQHFIAAIKPVKACVTAIAIGKNIYQYDKLLAVLTLTSKDQAQHVLPLIFQAASIQAHDGLGPKPWFGFSHISLENEIRAALASATFNNQSTIDVDGFSPLALLTNLLRAPTIEQPLDSGSQGYLLVPNVDANWTTYLVSQLRTLQTGNPFTSQVLLDAGVVQIQPKTGFIRTAYLPSIFNIVTTLEVLQDQSSPMQPTDSAHLSALLEMSR